MPAWHTVEPEGWVAGGARASVLSAAEQTPAAVRQAVGQEQLVSEESLEREDAFLLPVPVPSPWAQFIQQSCFKHRSDTRLGPIAPGATR